MLWLFFMALFIVSLATAATILVVLLYLGWKLLGVLLILGVVFLVPRRRKRRGTLYGLGPTGPQSNRRRNGK